MHRLGPRDLSGALRFISACDPSCGVQAFATSVTSGLPALIPADVATFGMADLIAGTLRAVENPRVTSSSDLDTWVRLTVTERSPNPPIDHFMRTRDPEARRSSD